MLAGMRIMMVEDEALIAMLLEELLTDLGCVVAGKASGLEDGLDAAGQLAVDAGVLDVNLGGKLSYPIAEKLLARNIPVLLATGYGTAGLPDHLRSTPVLSKPYTQRQLGAALLRLRSAG